ncbi:Translation factor [Coniochaeta hoffmannii]|uniref:Threonylcarbamoyl-AMP synthase n=1 Tax=Coniochaeta hoffmannii TaxID=91930 RepID=A0AA38RPL2_9PEZI|nr:Translation factor [Coniochaeta hoffmannii]
METRILKVTTPQEQLGYFSPSASSSPLSSLAQWVVPPSTASDPALSQAAQHLRETDIPVAFPTETVYGLGADATRSAAVKGIYTAKGRPSDNPLIVHVCDLDMLRSLLRPSSSASPQKEGPSASPNGSTAEDDDPIPAIYRPLIQKFWPGPLTILLPNPAGSKLAPEVTAGLPTFGARMPASALARSLISLAGAPLAAPSANASTRPSPTSARHVADDLAGRIAVILDSGEGLCGVGVESTVVDGLCEPPVVLRPGGVGIDEIRGVTGWEGVGRAYRDGVETGKSKPRAPGMKYKHYSPRARVVLYEAGGGGAPGGVVDGDLREVVAEEKRTVGVIRTVGWPVFGGIQCEKTALGEEAAGGVEGDGEDSLPCLSVIEGRQVGNEGVKVLDLDLGGNVQLVAQGLFAGLRELDRRGADVIFIEGVPEGEGIAAAVMNRLRKAASVIKG